MPQRPHAAAQRAACEHCQPGEIGRNLYKDAVGWGVEDCRGGSATRPKDGGERAGSATSRSVGPRRGQRGKLRKRSVREGYSPASSTRKFAWSPLREGRSQGVIAVTTAPDPDDFVARVFSSHSADLLRFLSRRGLSRADAHDVAQEAYVRLLRVHRKDLIENPQAYVYRIAANLLYEQQLKQRHDREGLRQLALDVDNSPTAASAERAAETLEIGKQLEAALRGLTPKCRAVLVLHRRDGLTYDEIAERLNISASMVKKYLSAGIRHCREHLRSMGHA